MKLACSGENVVHWFRNTGTTFSDTWTKDGNDMGVKNRLRRLLGLIEGHEDKVARQVSKRTNMSERQVRDGLHKIQETVNKDSNADNRDQNRD